MVANGHADFEVSMIRYATDTETVPQSFRSVLEQISSGRWAAPVARIREAFAAGGKDLAAAPKKKLPAVLFSGTFARRANEALTLHSGLICVDLDELGPTLEATRDLIASDPHTLAAFISPTGSGLKVVFRCDPSRPHIESYRAAERYVLEHFGLAIDAACKDVARMCFVSHDPDAFIANDAAPLPYPPEKVVFLAPEEKKPGALLLDGLKPGDDYDARADVPSLLLNHGWTKVGREGWRRPDKTDGISATWNHVPNRLFVFSSSTEFTANEVYKPWHVFAFLEHGGDFKKAARALSELGYGEQRPKLPPKPLEVDFDGEVPRPTVLTELAPRLFDPSKKIEKPRCIYSLGGTQICTPGNLTTLYSQAKTGKSSFIGSMLAAAMTNPTAGHDTLGLSAPNYAGHALLHFDTEQSPYDWQQLVLTALRRVSLPTPPAWLLSYTLTGVDALKCRAMVDAALADARARFGGVHSVIIDGVADLVIDPNDSEECFPTITHLHAQAIEYDTSIISVLHMNPGSDVKGRGHLGSQLERKSESNLTMEKDGEDVTKIYSTKQRGKAITKDRAVTFKWSDEHQMHRSCAPSESADKPRAGGRPETFKFSIFRSVFPVASAEPQTLTVLARTLSTNMPITPKQLGNVIERWERDGFIEVLEAQGAPRRYRMRKI